MESPPTSLAKNFTPENNIQSELMGVRKIEGGCEQPDSKSFVVEPN